MPNASPAAATGVMPVQVNNVFTYQLTATPALDIALEVKNCHA